MPRLTISLPTTTLDQLAVLARAERRDPRNQLVLLLEQALAGKQDQHHLPRGGGGEVMRTQRTQADRAAHR